MSASQESQIRLGRRTVVTAGAAGLAVALTACGAGAEDAGGSGSTEPAGQGDGAPLTATSDVPEGGGVVFADQEVVVTQPKPGEFKAFSSKCTHQGCAVKGVSGGVITCPCHNSTFDAATGEVTGGPAPRPLPEKKIRVEGGSITLV
ncbi:Rieske (2Fe-2S) protein [Streptomyces sp. NPDC006296]|uniref:Rieske (2Fe-2S) protein n=1 Tax=Streptomyces sp. NPDC006296 TaxID=3156746 RepID=UPI0033A1A048